MIPSFLVFHNIQKQILGIYLQQMIRWNKTLVESKEQATSF